MHDAGGCTLTIGDSAPILGDCHVGDSIAVNGACLTVVEFDKTDKGGWFTVWLANETLDRTDLGALPCLRCTAQSGVRRLLMNTHTHVIRLGERKVGDQVNLERAMGAHVRFGGHFVQVRLLAGTVCGFGSR